MRSSALGHVPNERDSGRDQPQRAPYAVTAATYSLLQAERETSRRIVVEPHQRRADDLECRHVHDLEGATIRCIERHDREATVGADCTGDTWSRAADGGFPPAGRDVVLAHAGRIGDSAREQGLAVGGESKVEEAFRLAPDDSDRVGAARDGGEQVGPRCGGVLEVAALDREQEGLVEVRFHQGLRDGGGPRRDTGTVGPVPLDGARGVRR